MSIEVGPFSGRRGVGFGLGTGVAFTLGGEEDCRCCSLSIRARSPASLMRVLRRAMLPVSPCEEA